MSDDVATALDRRRLLQLARRYRSKGYSVVIPDGVSSVPAFLKGYRPDFIAESEDDKVVVVVKRAAAIPGSNDLVNLAASIERHPGWRFELVVLETPAALLSLDEPTFDDLNEETRSLIECGFTNAAFIVAWSRIDAMAMAFATIHRIDPYTRTHARLIQDMATLGLISGETRGRLSEALRMRNAIAHASSAEPIQVSDVEALLVLGQDLLAEADVQKVA